MDRQLEQLKAIEVEQQIKAFNEGYKLGQEAAKQIYKQDDGSGAEKMSDSVNGQPRLTEATTIHAPSEAKPTQTRSVYQE